MKPGILVLEDGEVFRGEGFGAEGEAFGEVVFNTGMTGYQEVLTDPSYEGQIVAMTYPHVGNYGINRQDGESAEVRVRGFVTRDLPVLWSSWRGEQGLEEYLSRYGVCGITEVDTRRLTRHLRERGAMRAGISTASTAPEDLLGKVRQSPSMAGADLTDPVSCPAPYRWAASGRSFKVAAYDFGIKFNSLRRLQVLGCEVTVYPARTPPSQVLADDPDGVFISNGPGDPAAVDYGIKAVRQLLGKVPLFGICLGHQLIALALGLETYKLRFGHRGVNHPVMRLSDRAVHITTQNHGFAVKESGFNFEPSGSPGAEPPVDAAARTPHGKARLTHLNLNDYTVEGFRLVDEPAFCVQFHPEAGPGPSDSLYLFDDFCKLMEQA